MNVKTVLFFILFSQQYIVFCKYHIVISRNVIKETEESSTKVNDTNNENAKVKRDTSIPNMENGIPNTFYNLTARVGDQDVMFRVMRGEAAKTGQVPYQIAFMALAGFGSYTAFCGGTLIARSKIVSAAHCFYKKSLSNCFVGTLTKNDFRNMYAVAGGLSTNARPPIFSNSGPQWRTMRLGKYPPSYKFPKDDICVVYTNRNFDTSQAAVGLIPYATRNNIKYHGKCIVSGFGRVNDREQSKVLLVGQVEVLSDSLCKAIHGKDMSKFLCTSSTISDVHKGDSGGPLVCYNTGDPKEKNMGILVGVVSGKKMGITAGSFFTRVSLYSELINQSYINKASYCFLLITSLINCVFSI